MLSHDLRALTAELQALAAPASDDPDILLGVEAARIRAIADRLATVGQLVAQMETTVVPPDARLTAADLAPAPAPDDTVVLFPALRRGRRPRTVPSGCDGGGGNAA